jgi:uncharacterized protein YndB with AHSA1/START domain
MKRPNYANAIYSVEIDLFKSTEEVFKHLIDLWKWWPEEFVGKELQLNLEFELKTGDDHYFKNKVIEFVPNQKLVWITTESWRRSDQYDWISTRFIFELTPKSQDTLLRFIYDGVVLENEKD